MKALSDLAEYGRVSSDMPWPIMPIFTTSNMCSFLAAAPRAWRELILLEGANKVLEAEFPELAETMHVQLPDERSRRVGQSIAAASLPRIVRE